MQTVQATYFDGRTARAHAVRLEVDGQEAVLRDDAGAELRRARLAALRVSERTRRAPRLVTWPDGAFCQVTDHAAFDALLAATGHHEGWVARAQNSWRLTAISLAGLLAAVLLAYIFVLPWGAARLARTVPPALEARLGDAALASWDGNLTKPSKLPAADQARIRENFAALVRPADPGHDYRIEFRRSAALGPNAIAFPGGLILVTDDMVELAGTGAGMMAVLAHEAGHVAMRHGLTQLIQASAVGAAAAWLLGDFSTLLAGMPAAMLTMHYSRDHEREADAYAVDILRRNHLPVSAFASVLQALDDVQRRKHPEATEGGASDFLATHPHTSERIEALRDMADQ